MLSLHVRFGDILSVDIFLISCEFKMFNEFAKFNLRQIKFKFMI